jgi:hypothetical protein
MGTQRGPAVGLPQMHEVPMVMHEHKPYWSPRRLFRWACVSCGNRLDQREPLGPANKVLEIKKPPSA